MGNWFNGKHIMARCYSTTAFNYGNPGWTNSKVYLLKSKATDDAANTETPTSGNSWTYDIEARILL